jgi:hypothetical protein
MFYWLPSFRTMLPWLIAAFVVWLILKDPGKAGADVSHFLHWLSWAASRIATFVGSI